MHPFCCPRSFIPVQGRVVRSVAGPHLEVVAVGLVAHRGLVALLALHEARNDRENGEDGEAHERSDHAANGVCLKVEKIDVENVAS